MQQGIKKLQWLEYLKVVFLEILNPLLCRVFANQVTNEEAKVVTMFTKLKCTCLSSVECFHILAGKINYGINIKDTHTPDNTKEKK